MMIKLSQNNQLYYYSIILTLNSINGVNFWHWLNEINKSRFKKL